MVSYDPLSRLGENRRDDSYVVLKATASISSHPLLKNGMRKSVLSILHIVLVVAPLYAQQSPAETAIPSRGSPAPLSSKIDLVVEDTALREALTKWLVSS